MLETLRQMDESAATRQESVAIYDEITDHAEVGLKTLVEKDFDGLVAFWSR